MAFSRITLDFDIQYTFMARLDYWDFSKLFIRAVSAGVLHDGVPVVRME